MALERANVLETVVPDVFGHAFLRDFLPREKLRMHAHDERFLVITAIKNTDASALRERFHATPEIIMIEVFACRCFKGENLTSLRIHTGHYVPDCSVFAGRVHRLKDQQ